MKVFQQSEIKEALQHAQDGFQALHLHRIIVNARKAPACFVDAVERGENIAHLFDQSLRRLRKTAFSLGVKIGGRGAPLPRGSARRSVRGSAQEGGIQSRVRISREVVLVFAPRLPFVGRCRGS